MSTSSWVPREQMRAWGLAELSLKVRSSVVVAALSAPCPLPHRNAAPVVVAVAVVVIVCVRAPELRQCKVRKTLVSMVFSVKIHCV